MTKSRECGETGGYLTVFLSLSLTLILSLFFTLIEGARINAIRMQFEVGVDTALNSALSEFNRALYQQYDLFFIDTSYGTSSPSAGNTEEHIKACLQENFQTGGLLNFGEKRDFTGIRTDSVSIGSTRFAADDSAAALREQITAYMTAEPIGENIENILQAVNKFNGFGFDVTSWHRKKAENDEFIANSTAVPIDSETGEEEPVNNPAEKTDSYRALPILYQVLGSTSNVSEESVNVGTLLSHRSFHTGDGELADNSHDYKRAESLLFDRYIFEKCGNYRRNEKKNKLKYQMEYILFGDGKDAGNLEKMAIALLGVREAANCIYIFGDSEKCAVAEAIGLAVSLFILSPELKDAFKIAVLFAWAYLESLQDVKTLFHGGKVPLMKNKSTWKTSVWGILTPATATTPQKDGSGLSYENYLQIFLFLENGNTKNYRLMDVMEMDVRKAEGTDSFRMDWCMDSFSADISISSSFGYNYEMTRAITYN